VSSRENAELRIGNLSGIFELPERQSSLPLARKMPLW